MPEQYQSALTGPQMDQALLDMANNTSERYAKGTANGAAVPSGAVGYHDNALYYKDLAANQAQTATNAAGSATNSATAASTSEANATTAAGTATSAATTATQQADRAENAADRAEAIVGGQFVSYGQDQGLTETQQAQARKNIAAGGTNPNLLDNWYFASGVINQRGLTSGSFAMNNSPIVDRWFATYFTASGSTWELTSDGLKLTLASDANVIIKQQYNPIIPALTGKTLIFSIELSDGTIYSSAPFIRNTSNQSVPIIPGKFNGSIRNDFVVWLQAFAGADGLTVKAFKLEIGTVSTLANDVLPSYADELAKCQRFFQRIYLHTNASFGFAYAYSGTSIRYAIPLPVPMRPGTVHGSLTGAISIRGNGQNLTPTSMGFNSYTSQPGDVPIQNGACAVSGATINQAYILTGTNETSYIDISTDIA